MGTVWLKGRGWDLSFGSDFGRSSSRCGGFELWSSAAGAHRAVALGELVHTAGGVDEALFTREVRMAGGADTDTEVWHGRDRVVHSTAGAGDGRLGGFWMDVFFHRGRGPRDHARRGMQLSPGRGAERVVFFRKWSSRSQSRNQRGKSRGTNVVALHGQPAPPKERLKVAQLRRNWVGIYQVSLLAHYAACSPLQNSFPERSCLGRFDFAAKGQRGKGS